MAESASSSAPEQTQPHHPHPRHPVWRWLKWVVALGLIAGLIYFNRKDISDFRNLEKDWGYLGIGFVLCLVATLSTFFRWYLLVRALDFPFRVWDAIRLGFMGTLFIYAGPGLVGGDLFKAVFLAREHPGRRAVAASTVFLDRLLGMLALFNLGAIASLFVPFQNSPEQIAIRTILWTGSVAGMLGIALLLQPWFTHLKWIQSLGRIPKLGPIFISLLNGLVLYQSRVSVIVIVVIMGIFNHVANFTGMYCCALALNLGDRAPNLWTHYYLMPAAAFAGLLPTPGGIGPQEWMIQHLYGIQPGAAGAMGAASAGFFAALAFRMLNVAIALIGVPFYLLSRKEVLQTIEQEEAELDEISHEAQTSTDL
ncbi:MAG: lysylphosphatidylglycerol synthase transmembrane domain-containing protein [Planctomycetales bacterium]